MHDDGLTRRSLLAGVGAVFAALVAGAVSLQRDTVAPTVARVRAALPKARRPLPPLPADPAKGIPGLSPLVTPTKDFFRIDNAGSVPTPSPDSWRLSIDGMVRKPVTLTYDDLLRREIIEVDATIACVSNLVGGPLVGNARWSGVRLDALIAEAQPLAAADEVMGHSVDAFTAGFPLSVLDGRDAIIAIGMNGELLPPEHGYPARLIVPGLYGYVSAVKWLQRIELTRFDKEVGYWVPLGWSRLAPIKLASRIDTPQPNASVKAGTVPVAGVAWAGTNGISAVHVRIDDGPWLPAQLGPEPSQSAWRQWWLAWDATAGDHRITVRATDAHGVAQSTRLVASAPNGAEGLHTIDITVS